MKQNLSPGLIVKCSLPGDIKKLIFNPEAQSLD